MIKKILEIIIVLALISILLIAAVQRFYVPLKQMYHNNKILKNDSQYTIMCLGESTTAGAYPIQLQQLLDKKYPNKFSIVDCGEQGILLNNILNLLSDNINKYNPNIAICMLDYMPYDKNINNKNAKEKEIKVGELLNDNDKEKLKYALELEKQNKHNDAEQLVRTILKNDENIFVEVVKFYFLNMKDYEFGREFASNIAIEALNKNFNKDKLFYYIAIFEYYTYKNDIKTLNFYTNKIINEDSDLFETQYQYYLYSLIEKYISDEQKKKIIDIMNENSSNFYGFLAIDAIQNKDYQKAQEYFDKAEEIRSMYPEIETYEIYKLIIKQLIDKNIKVICMQYPIRSIVSLQNILKNENYYDKLTFISNEYNFKNALKDKSYYELFKDQTAGDFGHCTDLGNTMIAENVIETLEKILDLKQN